jgi:multicomponent Na+:H+ antiporter subunit D
VLAALEQGRWILVAAVVASSLLAVAYVWRIVEVAYFQGPARADIKEAPWSLLAPTWILVLANFWLGIDTRATVGMAEQAARALLGAGP